MELSKRLYLIANSVRCHEIVADVGCDHGYTSIWLCKNDRVKKAIAMDILKGPLKKAEENVKKYGMQDRIELRLSDGLTELKEGEASSVIISGMGGILITKILSDNKSKLESIKELILSPQSEPENLRKFLYLNNFKIDFEDMICDAGKYYVVIHAVPGQSDLGADSQIINKVCNDLGYEISESDIGFYLKYGAFLIKEKNPVFLEFAEREVGKMSAILKNLEKKNPEKENQSENLTAVSERAMKRCEELKDEIAFLKRVSEG